MLNFFNMSYVLGIDEVGRGPIAGPVVVACCAIKKGVSVLHFFPKGVLRDSKKLSTKARLSILEKVKPLIEDKNIVFGVGVVPAERIDEIGIVPSIKEATAEALKQVHTSGVSKDSFVYLDGSLSLPLEYKQETVIKGDEKIEEIALASIYAKEYRDSYMKDVGEKYPLYGFESHVGYGTKKHYEAIKNNGFCPLHRRSFLTGYS